jgi:hypothetical protein
VKAHKSEENHGNAPGARAGEGLLLLPASRCLDLIDFNTLLWLDARKKALGTVRSSCSDAVEERPRTIAALRRDSALGGPVFGTATAAFIFLGSQS